MMHKIEDTMKQFENCNHVGNSRSCQASGDRQCLVSPQFEAPRGRGRRPHHTELTGTPHRGISIQ